MEPNNFIEKDLYNFIPFLKNNGQDTINNIILSYSLYKNIIFIIVNGNLLYNGKFSHDKNDFSINEINLNNENKYIKSNSFKKIKTICLTENNLFILTDEKLIFYSDYNNVFFSKIEGPIQQKKIMSIACSRNDILFLTYAGLVYHSNDKNKENQKLINELLDYNISSISAGSNHFLALGSVRNNDYYNNEEIKSPQDKNCILFSWGDNTYHQCGLNNNKNYVIYPTIISKSFGIKQISSGNNHNMILLNNGNIIFFGDNIYNQCFYENENFVQLPKMENIEKNSLFNEFLNLRGEYIQKIKAKENSSLLISNKGTLIFNGKIFNNKQKIFLLEKSINFRPWSCFSDNFFLVLKNRLNKYVSNNIFKEVNYNKNSFLINKSSFFENNYNNEKCYFKKKITSHRIPTRRHSSSLAIEYLKNEKKSEINSSLNRKNSESLIQLRSYINALGISLTSTYDDSQISFRPSNLPSKTKEEEKLHRELVHNNRIKYIDGLKKKQELEKSHILYLEKEKEKKEKIKEYWLNNIIPNWSIYKGNYQVLEKYIYDGIPNTLRGRIWILCIGNKFCITKDFYDIGFQKSIQLLMKLSSKNKNTEKKLEEDFNKIVNNTKEKETNESLENFSQDYLILSEKTKRKYSQYITKTLDKEQSIYLIDLDIERTFQYLGIFNKNSPLGESLREILRIFVVTRPDIGYVQGLSYIAGILLTQMDKFQAFTCFCNIILSPNIFTFYKLDDIGIKKRLDLFNEILKINLPNIYNLFLRNEVLPEYYLLEWIMTLFTRTFHIELVLRIWDVYMIEGILALYRASVAIIILIEKELINLDFSEILNKLKDIKNLKIEEDQFLEYMKKVKFNNKIKKFIDNFNEDYLPIEEEE